MASQHDDGRLGDNDHDMATWIMRLEREVREKLAEQDNECLICTVDLHEENYTVLACGHIWCKACVAKAFSQAVIHEELFPPKCCGQIDTATVIDVLNEELVTAFRAKSIEYGTANRLYCSRPTCSAFLSPYVVNGAGVVTCVSCQSITCTICKAAGHGEDCPEDTDAGALRDLAEQMNWKACPSCSQMVELGEGCNHITCPCGTHFCYLCRALWKTCECDIGAVVMMNWDEIRGFVDAWGPDPHNWRLPFQVAMPLDDGLRLARVQQAGPPAQAAVPIPDNPQGPAHARNRRWGVAHINVLLHPDQYALHPAPPAPADPIPHILREFPIVQDQAYPRVDVLHPPRQAPQVQQANDRPVLNVHNRTNCRHGRTRHYRGPMTCGECDQDMLAYGYQCRDCHMTVCRACTRGRWY